MKVIALARVSHALQDSNEAQLDRMKQYFKRYNFTDVKIYKIKESSTKDDRKHFNSILEEIRKSKERVVFIVETVDRMQRSFRESLALDELRAQGKVQIHFLRENLILDEKSNSSDLTRWDLAVLFARSYVLQLSDNVKRKQEYLIRNGVLPGKAPFGYKNITRENGEKDIVPDVYNSKIVQKVYELYGSGAHSLLSIRIKLKEDYNLEISNGLIDQVLKNRFYIGDITSKGNTYPHKYVTLIDRELFAKVQDIKAGHKKKHFKYAGLPYIYRGLIRCAECGCMVTPERAKKRYVYYHCTNYKRKHNETKVEWLSENEITNQLASVFERMQVPSDTLDVIVQSLRSVHEGKSIFREEQLKKLTEEKNRYAKRIEGIYLDKLDGSITSNKYDELYTQFRNKEEEIDRKLFNIQQAEDNYYVTTNYLLDLANRAHMLFKSSEMEQKRQLIKLTLQNLNLNGRKIEFNAIKPFDIILNFADHQLWLGCLDSNQE